MRVLLSLVLFSFIALAAAFPIAAQTAEFTYQGNLQNSSAPATGSFDFEFLLFDALTGGTQIGGTLTRSSVAVSAGTFSVKLDFGASFPGANRYLEIRVKQTGGGAFTPLAPRQAVNSSPYSVKSLNADNASQLGGVAASQYVTSPSGSAGFIQNTTTQQASSNFVISGDGMAGGTLSANNVNATTQYTIAGVRVMHTIGTLNFFAGLYAGNFTMTGISNTASGSWALSSNTTGHENTASGGLALTSNETGYNNTANGYGALYDNKEGYANTANGSGALQNNKTGYNNTASGYAALASNETGIENTAIGRGALVGNTTGGYNTALGTSANVGSGALTNATAIGAQAYVTQSNSLVLGSIIGVNSAIADTNVGIGTTTPAARLDVNGSFLARSGSTITGTNGDGSVITARRATGDSYINIDSTTVSQNSVLAYRKNNFNRWLMFADSTTESGGNAGSNFRLDAYNDAGVGIANYVFVSRSNGNVGIGTDTPNGRLDVNGMIRVGTLDTAGGTSLCLNSSNKISTCSSSARYKNNINSFNSGLSLIKQLRPVSFNWRANNQADLGLVAEDVAKVEPLLTTTNAKGEIEGVKYDRVGVVLVNAVKEQQAQIEDQQKQIEQQRVEIEQLKKKAAEIDEIKTVICGLKPDAQICKSLK